MTLHSTNRSASECDLDETLGPLYASAIAGGITCKGGLDCKNKFETPILRN
jgi:hypothetical protein